MTTKTEFELTLGKCYRALQLILDKKTLAIPRNYDVWYNYVSGDVKALIEAVDAHLAKSGDVTQQDLDRLYEKFLCPVARLAQSGEIGSRICGEVGSLTDTLAEATSRTRDYRGTLSGAAEKLGAGPDPAALNDLVSAMLASTADMVAYSESLERNLEVTRAQVMALNDALADLQAETLTDALTGLANRKKFDRDLETCIADAEETGTELCLLIGDVDHFKKFNDMHGHQTGDEVLRQVARTLKGNVKKAELVSRYGGEEFAVILPRTNLQGAVAIANRIRSAVSAMKISSTSDGARLDKISMSFGAARHARHHTVGSFVERADAGLYAAKKAGRNCVRTEVDAEPDRDSAVA